MPFPVVADELVLHARVLSADPLSSADLFQVFMEPIVTALRGDLRCTEDEAHDSAIDALFAYLDQPVNYDSSRGRLCTYLMSIAKKRAIDRIRARSAARRRDDEYLQVVELQASDPKESMEMEAEAANLWRKVEMVVPEERDRQAIKLILAGERSTEAFAQVYGLTAATDLDLRRQVKQHRDRLVKVLERLGTRMSYAKDA
ncbi:MAG TPA: hypothetical protein VG963_27805 [Polyangiaceae bacterium]|nr:hypothetical protein [Polyangiaceae bacterium]